MFYIRHSAPKFFWAFDGSKFRHPRRLDIQACRLEWIMPAAVYVASLQTTDTEFRIQFGDTTIAWINCVDGKTVCTPQSRYWSGAVCEDFWPLVKSAFDAALADGPKVPPDFYGEHRERDWARAVDRLQQAAHAAATAQDCTAKLWRSPQLTA